ncbi:uncharacterized protein LOC142162341 [Nicotiana tabacum]|uniref:Uncharacterized protein LOC142162341 n=1 Tax=Nicotiana tabacum TaxID=4097 RepID=A0AC58RPX8_TOBAC
MAVQKVAMPIIANVTSSIVKPRITGHFELKQSMIQLLHANGQFMGLPHEDPQHHILNFLEISDTYITNGVTPDYVRLTLFPFSLLGEAKRWLKAEPANSITTWNDLARKFLERFFPSGKTAKIRSEIVAFKQKAGESLYSAWERFKGLLRDYPHHNQTNEVLAHTFIEGLHFEKKIVVDAAAGDWQEEMGRHIVQKSAGVLELDVVSALSTQIATLTNQVNQMNLSNSNRGQTNQYGNTYNPNWRNYPNFSWGGNQGAQNQYRSQAPQQQYRPPQVEQQASPTSHLEDMFKKMMAEQQALSQKVMAEQQALATTVTFNERPTTIESISEKAKETEKPAGEAVAEQPPQLVARPPPPFPQILQKLRDNVVYKKFLNILKQVQINIPLVDILQEVPKYAKYIKDIVANKRRLTEFETVALTEECSSKIQGKLPQKLNDPGSFTIQISIGKHVVGRALCNLGASINLMSLSVFRQLRLGELRPTIVILQLADRSLAHPKGVIEDVLVQVGSFIFPADFIILDYEPD